MIVAGASRHAKEIIELLHQQDSLHNLFLYDDLSGEGKGLLFEQFPIIKTPAELKSILHLDKRFVLGLGGTVARSIMSKKMTDMGAVLHSIVARSSKLGHFGNVLGNGLNIMEQVLITNDVRIGEGSLINAGASVHHDVRIGNYCEIGPRATLLGGAIIGDFTMIGSGAIVLPDRTVGSYSLIGAGAVVTTHIPDYSVAVGVPAKIIKHLPHRESK